LSNKQFVIHHVNKFATLYIIYDRPLYWYGHFQAILGAG